MIPVELARARLAAGLSVLPAARARKRPAIGSWKTWAGRLPTDVEVEAWFSNGHDAICVVAGAVSGNVECIDFDCGGEMFGPWREKVDPALMASLVVETTPSGGRHVVYRCTSPVEGNRKLAQGMRGGRRATLIETRGEGGLFLCAPSDGYTLEQGEFERLPVLDEAARGALLAAACELDECRPEAAEGAHAGSCAAFAANGEGGGGFLVKPGDDFCARGDIRPLLLARGWRLLGTRQDGNELWQRPGKTGDGNSATFNGSVLWVFSTNAAPFEAKAYSKFQVYALLEHGGDFTAAAKALLELGYGRREEPADFDVDAFMGLDARGEGEDEGEVGLEYEDPGPIPDELFSVPGFVDELMGYTLRTAPYPNRALAFAGAFAMAAHLAGRRFTDECGTRPNVYILSLAGSGTGKQHPRSVNASLAAIHGFASSMGDYFASGEGLEDSLLVSPSSFFQLDECDAIFNTMKMKSDARAEMINSMLLRFYSESGSVHIMRKKAMQRGQPSTSSAIVNPHLTFLGTAVPRFLYQSLSERTLENGLLARCLVLEAGRRGRANEDFRTEDFPERVTEDIREFIRVGHEAEDFTECPHPRVVPVEAAARLRLKEVRAAADGQYEAYERRDCQEALALWARAAEKVSKFALVYALSRSVRNPVVTVEGVDWAERIVFHATRRMLYMSGLYVYDGEFGEKMKRVLQRISVKGRGRMSRRELLRCVSIDLEELRRVVETLVERGDIRIERGARGGTVYALNRREGNA